MLAIVEGGIHAVGRSGAIGWAAIDRDAVEGFQYYFGSLSI